MLRTAKPVPSVAAGHTVPMPDPETFTPESLDEVAALLLAADDAACPVPRGTRLLAQAGGAAPTPIVVDLARVPELNRLDYDERSGLLIGAAVPLVESLRFPPVCQTYAILADGIDRGGCAGRGMSFTLAEALGVSPFTADLAVPLICLGATVAIFGPHGWSETSVEALCVKRRGTALQPGEFLVDVRLPALSGPCGGAYACSPTDRVGGDPVGAGAFVVMREDLDTCCGARVMLWTAADDLLRALETERFLQGRRLGQETVERAGDLVAESDRPAGLACPPGPRASVLRDVTCEALRRALDRARRAPASASDARRRRSSPQADADPLGDPRQDKLI